MTTLSDDLVYLAREAFSFSLNVNPHAPFHSKIDEEVAEDDPEDWITPEQRAEAYRTGRFISGYVYPTGSVGFFRLNGTDIVGVVSKLADLCRTDIAEYTRQGLKSRSTSRAFDPTPLPET